MWQCHVSGEKTDLVISGSFINSGLFKMNSKTYKAKIAEKQWLIERSKFDSTLHFSLEVKKKLKLTQLFLISGF